MSNNSMFSEMAFSTCTKRLVPFGMGIVLLALLLVPADTAAQSGPGDNPDEPPVASTPSPDRILFLRGDQGVSLSGSEVTTWADQSGNNNDAAPSGTTGPELVPSPTGLNGKPTLRFDRTNDEEGLEVPNTNEINTDGPYPERTIALTFRTGSDVNTRQMLYEEGGGVNGFNVYLDNGRVTASAWDSGWTGEFIGEGQYAVSASVDPNTTYVLTFVFDADAGSQLQLFVNGVQEATNDDSSIGPLSPHSGNIFIGNVGDGTQIEGNDVSARDGFGGDISELVLSNTAFNTAQRQIFESALSEKYGVSITNDRYAQAGYEYDVIGVGQAGDGTKQTSDSLGVLSFSTSSLSNGNFGLLGHEGSNATFEGETDPTNIGERLSRVWRVGGTGTLPSLTVEFDVSSYSLGSNQDYKLLLESSGGTFGTGATVVDGTLNGDTFTVSGSALSSAGLSQGDYLTLAKTSGDVTAPAGLSYSPNPVTVANSDVATATATASFTTEGQPTPSFSVVDVRRGLAGSATSIGASLPDGITLEGDGDVTVDPTASSQGRFEIDIEASNSGGTSNTATLVVEITEAVAVEYTSQTVSVQPNGTFPSLSVAPTSPSINEGSRTFSVVSGSLPAGLSLSSSSGDVTGTPTETGRGRAVIEVSGSDMATGTAQDTLNLSVLGSAGPVGVGNDPADGTDAGAVTLDLDASTLAKSDGETVDTWTDGSNYSNDATGGDAPYVGGVPGLNDRPAVDFSGATQALAFNSDQFNNNTDAPFYQRTITVAFQTGSSIPSGSTPEAIYTEGGGANGISMYLRNSNLYVGMWSNNQNWGPHFVNALNDEGAPGEGTLGSIDPNTAYVLTLVFNADAGRFSVYLNGTLIGTQATDVAALARHNEVVIGGGTEAEYDVDGGGEAVYDQFTGEIAEVVAYETALPRAQRQIVESGLGAKYGIGVSNNRFDFAGTEEVTFGSDVIGVGQTADNPNAHTPQAASDLITVSPGGALSDGDFTVIGTDDSSAVFSKEADITDFDGSGTNVGSRLVRTWRVDVTNTAAFGYGDLSVDVSSLNLLSGQSYVLLADSDPSFTGSATVVEGTVSSGTFTPSGTVHGSALADADYLTLARTEGDAVAPSNLTYDSATPPDTIVIENGIGPDSTAAPSYDGGSPAPSFSITDVRDSGGSSIATPSAISVDAETGILTVDAETSLQGVFSVDVQASNTDGTSSATVTVRIVEPVELNYDIPSQMAVVDDGSFNAIQTATPADLSTVNDATVNYSVVEGSLGSLTLNSDGRITGTPTRTGVIRAVVQATGSEGASGTVTEEVNISVVGADGPATVGDAFADGTDEGAIIADFDASTLSADNGDELTAWTDVSNYGNTVNLNAGTGPLYRTGSNTTGFNGRPAVDFSNASGPSDLLVMSDNPEFNNGGDPYVQRTVATVFRTSDDISGTQPEGIYGEGGGTRGLSIYTRDGDLYAGMWNLNEDDETGPWGPHFFSAETDEGASGEGTVTINGDETYLVTLRYHFVESELAIYVNGTLIGKQTTQLGRFFDHANAVVGGGENFVYDDGTTNYDEFEGQIGELLVYDVALPDAQRQILESTLAAKYGLAPIANARFTDATYSQNVVGFGQLADNPAPHDPTATTDIITINPSVGGDGDFGVIGHDDSSNVFAPEDDLDDYRDDGSTTLDDQIDSRLQRTWRAAVSGSGAFDASNLTFDVSDPAFNLAEGQEFAILIGRGPEFPGNDDTKVVTGTTDTTATDTTFTPGTGTTIGDGQYVTLAKKLGDPAKPSNLSYPTVAVEAGTENTETGAPAYDGGQPLPSFGVVSADKPLPSGISIDSESGAITVDASTASQATFTFDVFAENGNGADTTTVTARVFERLEEAVLVRTLPEGETLPGTPIEFTPTLSSINGASVSYTVQRVNAFGTIQGDLSGTGLSFDPGTGEFSGAPDQQGTVAVTLETVGSGGAEGTLRTEVKITTTGGTGVAGVGDTTNTILDLSADNLPALADGDPVTTWPDTSVYGHDATVGNAPTYKTDAINGQSVLRFDGSDQLSIASSTSLNDINPILHRAYTIVFRPDDVSGTRNIYDEQGGTRGYRLYIDDGQLRAEGRNNSTSDDLVDPGQDNLSSSADPTTPWENETNGDGDVFASTSVTAGQTYVATLFHDYARGTIELWVNGESKGSMDGAGRQYGHTNGVIGNGGFDGDLGTLYATDASLNTTQRTILHNALAAQYGVGLASGATDVYAGHTSGNGDYDLGVVGIGQEAATDNHVKGTRDGLRLKEASGLDDGDYLVAGYRTEGNGVSTTDINGVSGLDARIERTWYTDVTDPGGDLGVDVTIDLSEAELGGIAGDAGNYVLLERGADASDGTSWSSLGGTATVANDDEITFTNVSLTDGNELTLGTTDRNVSPLGGATIVLNGTDGNEGSVNTSPTGGDAGYALLGPPKKNATFADLASDTDPQFIEFGLPGPMIYTYEPSTDSWAEVTSGSTSMPNGEGFALFIFDDEGSPQADPVDPTLPIAVKAGSVPTGDVTRNPSNQYQWVFLANPFAAPFDVGSVTVEAGGSLSDYSNMIQIWNPDGNMGNGQWEMIDRTTNPTVGVGQGFFFECTTYSSNACPTELTLPRSGRVQGGDRTIVGFKSQQSDARTVALDLGLTVTSDSQVVARDDAARVVFSEAAAADWERFDATKLAPFLGEYATLAPLSPAGDSLKRAAQAGLPWPSSDTVTVPLETTAVGVSGTATVSLDGADNLTGQWTVEVVDTKGTADPSDDTVQLLRPDGDGYSFTLSGAKSGAAGAGVSSSSSTRAAGSPGALTLTDRLRERRSGPGAKARTTDSGPRTRLRLRITPPRSALPVELADLSATSSDAAAVVKWQTASETNNAGFYVEHQRLPSDDTTATPRSGEWTRMGFVDGAGTTSEPRRYRYETGKLAYGRHVFRLRQVDTDGTETTTDPVQMERRLQSSYAVGEPYPNPARQQATLPVTVREAQAVTVQVYDVLGRRVRTAHTGRLPAQKTEDIRLSTGELASGNYFVRVRGDDFAVTRRLVVVR